MAVIRAEYHPTPTPEFHVFGPNAKFAHEIRDRLRAGTINVGFGWEPGLIQIVAHWRVVRSGSGSDLALACTALRPASSTRPR
ncbi:hypothetical protein AQJ58_24655 [Streptomyces sp. DSM 15324]|nr:hypothetical protein AQJ58_24655 [Streptomyces sp. DSM 15324]